MFSCFSQITGGMNGRFWWGCKGKKKSERRPKLEGAQAFLHASSRRLSSLVRNSQAEMPEPRPRLSDLGFRTSDFLRPSDFGPRIYLRYAPISGAFGFTSGPKYLKTTSGSVSLVFSNI